MLAGKQENIKQKAQARISWPVLFALITLTKAFILAKYYLMRKLLLLIY